eukprot:1159244-Pelagomonas_calceolata.AAC.3
MGECRHAIGGKRVPGNVQQKLLISGAHPATLKGWLTHEARVVREPNLKARRHNSLHMHQSQGSIQENHHANQGAWTHECVLCARGWGDLRLPDECVLCVPEECVQCTTGWDDLHA